jgi:hypothetical protein
MALSTGAETVDLDIETAPHVAQVLADLETLRLEALELGLLFRRQYESAACVVAPRFERGELAAPSP